MRQHILTIEEENYPEKFRLIIRRLKKAMANKKVMEQMSVEDDFINILRMQELDIERILKEKEEERRQKEEAQKLLENGIRKLHTVQKMNVQDLTQMFNKTELEIAEIIGKTVD